MNLLTVKKITLEIEGPETETYVEITEADRGMKWKCEITVTDDINFMKSGANKVVSRGYFVGLTQILRYIRKEHANLGMLAKDSANSIFSLFRSTQNLQASMI